MLYLLFDNYTLIHLKLTYIFLLFTVFNVESPTITIPRVSRHHMGAYLCIASNGIPPTVSKRIMVIVNCKFFENFILNIIFFQQTFNINHDCKKENKIINLYNLKKGYKNNQHEILFPELNQYKNMPTCNYICISFENLINQAPPVELSII